MINEAMFYICYTMLLSSIYDVASYFKTGSEKEELKKFSKHARWFGIIGSVILVWIETW